MRVGITVKDLARVRYKRLNGELFRSGCKQHSLMFVTLVKNMGCTPVMVGTTSSNTALPSSLDGIEICDLSNLHGLRTLDVLFCPGLLPPRNTLRALRESNIKVIDIILGNMFQYDIWSLFHTLDDPKNPYQVRITLGDIADETWISPHFAYTKEYYEFLFGREKVHVMPYFWEPRYCMDRRNVMPFEREHIKVAIMESNQTWGKNCMIPLLACNIACKCIEETSVFGVQGLVSGDTPRARCLKKLIEHTDLWKSKKLTIQPRLSAPYILSSLANVVVSHVDSWDLNFLHLECFYLGIPLIHNSKPLKNYGFYYSGHSATDAAAWIQKLYQDGFNRDAYIERNKGALQQFSVESAGVLSFYENKIKGFTKSRVQSRLTNHKHRDSLSRGLSITRVTGNLGTFYPHELAICCAIRNCAKYLPKVFQNINGLRKRCRKLHCIFAFDNCSDNSQSVLEEYKKSNENVTVLEVHNPSPIRTVRIARARNSCLDVLYGDAFSRVRHHIMVDADDKGSSPWDVPTIVQHLNNAYCDNWDSLSFNRPDYYDAWALSFGAFKHHCWGFQRGHVFKISSIMNEAIKKELELSKTNTVEVYSAFNGFAIYKTERFSGYRYSGLYRRCATMFTDEDRRNTLRHLDSAYALRTSLITTHDCCEHLYYHLRARKDGRIIKVSRDMCVGR